jgi:quercetin dioxygenase-like cupin family protein
MMSSEQAKTQEHAAGVVKQSQSVPLKDVTAGAATRMHVLIGPDDGAPHFAMRRFVMETDGGMPAHTNQVEHEQYVLRGRAEVGIGGKVHKVESGDVLYIPAGAPHYYKVIEAPFEFLCMVPNAPDKTEIVPDGR